MRKIVFSIYLDPTDPTVRPHQHATTYTRTWLNRDGLVVAQTIEEMYDFRITYPGGDDHTGAPSVTLAKDNVEVVTLTKKEIKKATQQMMRTLVTLTQTLKVRSHPARRLASGPRALGTHPRGDAGAGTAAARYGQHDDHDCQCCHGGPCQWRWSRTHHD